MTITRPIRSRFITVLALISIMGAFYSIMQDFFTLSLQSSAEFGIARQLLPSAMISPAEIYFDITLSIAGIAASVGLFMRRNWGRIMYMAVLSLYTLWSIYSSISTYAAFDMLLKGYGGSLSLILFWSVLGLGINIYLIWRLSSYAVRQEFETAAFFVKEE